MQFQFPENDYMKNYGLYDQNLDKDLGVITLSLAMLE